MSSKPAAASASREGPGLTRADLQHQRPAGTERGGRARNDSPDHVHAVEAAVQRQARLVAGHLGRERPDRPSRQVGQVRDDQLHAGAARQERLDEVALHATRPGRRARGGPRWPPPPRGPRASGRRRAPAAPGRAAASAQAMAPEPVPMSAARVTPRASITSRAHVDQPLRLRPRDEHGRAHGKPEAAEILEAEQVLQRLARGPARQQGAVAGRLGERRGARSGSR